MKRPIKQDAAAPDKPPSRTSRWLGFARGGVGALIVAIITPVLLLSETRLKEAFDGVFGGCLFVIDIAAPQKQQVAVHGYMTGKPPQRLNLTFRAPQGHIEKIEFKSGVLAKSLTPYSSLNLHPKAGQSCPGELCAGLPVSPSSMTIQLNDPSSSHDYVFNVLFAGESDTAPAGGNRLVVYSIASPDQKGDVCRVEPANAFNFLVRLDKLERFGAYALILVLATILLLMFKKWRESDEPPAKR